MAKIPLAAARVAKGLTQKDLADKLGVSSQLVWEWENTNKPIKPVYLYAVCHVTGFSPDDILLPGELKRMPAHSRVFKHELAGNF